MFHRASPMRQSVKPNSARATVKRARKVALLLAGWLSDRSLLCVVAHSADIASFERAAAVRNGSTLELEVFSARHPADHDVLATDSVRSVVVLRASRPIRSGQEFRLSLAAGTENWHIEPASMAAALTDLRTVIRGQFTALNAQDRSLVVRFLVSTGAPSGAYLSDQLRESRSLHVVREMLRERLPKCELSANRVEGLSVEALIRVSETHFYLEGWICDVESSAVRLTAVSPEGGRAELLGRLFRYDRPDVETFFKPTIGVEAIAKCGFICYFNLENPSRLPSGWIVEMATAAGTVMETVAPPVLTGVERLRAKLLGDLGRDQDEDQELRRLHISPALSMLQAEHGARVRVERVLAYGAPPSKPRVSVLVPLYGRIDLMEHQIVQFANDRDLQRADLIYVLDSPERKTDLIGNAERLFRLYGLSLRVIILSENAGFSLANNIAASYARARLLVLLNSDVLPRQRGWLSRMADLYEALDQPGAAGPMLLYEDESLQHAGLYFERPHGSQLWSNEHYYKGLHSELPAAKVPRPVPAVTAACLMVDADLYERVGGLSGTYVQGDYEDSDLCLRLRDAGRTNWYLPQVQLYHLEAQSYPSALRNLNREYNRWLFNETWSEIIAAMTAGLDSTAPLPTALSGSGRPTKKTGHGSVDNVTSGRAEDSGLDPAEMVARN